MFDAFLLHGGFLNRNCPPTHNGCRAALFLGEHTGTELRHPSFHGSCISFEIYRLDPAPLCLFVCLFVGGGGLVFCLQTCCQSRSRKNARDNKSWCCCQDSHATMDVTCIKLSMQIRTILQSIIPLQSVGCSAAC